MDNTSSYQPNSTLCIELPDDSESTGTVTNEGDAYITINVDGSPVVLKPGEQLTLTHDQIKGLLNAGTTGSFRFDRSQTEFDDTTHVPLIIPPTSPNGLDPDAYGDDNAERQQAVPPQQGLTIKTPEKQYVSKDETTIVNRDRTTRSTTAGDPVNLFTGSFELAETDVVVPGGAFDLVFTRSYKSGALFAGPLGWNWDHNHNFFIRQILNRTDTYGRWTGQGHEDLFEKQASGEYQPPPGVFDFFEVLSSTSFRVTKPGGTVYQYDTVDTIASNRIYLTSVTDRFGNQLSYTYDIKYDFFYLQKVTDELTGRSLRFDIGSCGLLEYMTDDYGREWFFYHDPDQYHHVAVKSPDGKVKGYEYSADFLGDPRIAHNIVLLRDGDGNVYLQNEYEEDPADPNFGRITLQYSGGFYYQYGYEAIQWAPQNPTLTDQQVQVTTVIFPDRSVQTYTFNYRGDLLEHRLRLIKDGSWNVVTRNYQYDEFGNLTLYIPRRTSMLFSADYRVQFDYATSSANIRMRGKLLKVTIIPASGSSTVVWEGEYLDTGLDQLLVAEYNLSLNYSHDYSQKDSFKTTYSYTSGFLTTLTPPNVRRADGVLPVGASVTSNPSLIVPGRVGTVTSEEGIVSSFDYGTSGEADGRLIGVTNDAGGLLSATTAIDYSATNFGLPSTVTDPTLVAISMEFNNMGLMTSMDLPSIGGLTGTKSWKYDSDGFVTEFGAPKGNCPTIPLVEDSIITKITRDIHREIREVTIGSNSTDPRTSTYIPDWHQGVCKEWDPAGTRTNRMFDERGMLLNYQLTGQDGLKGPLYKNKYDLDGQLIERFQSILSGSTETHFDKTLYLYDAFKRVTEIQPSINAKTKISYLWVTTTTTTSSSSTTFGVELYNPLIVREEVDSSANVYSRTITEFDKRGRMIQQRVAEFEDALIGTPAYASTKFVYDRDDRLIQIIGPRTLSQITYFDYDNLGRVIQRRDPEGNIRNYGYDLAGRLTSVELQDNNSAYPSLIWSINRSDDRKRITSVETPDGVEWQVNYDDRDLPIEVLLPATFDDANQRSISTEYGVSGEILSRTEEVSSSARTFEWEHDGALRLTNFIDSDGKETVYQYDSIGRPIKVLYPSGYWMRNVYDVHGRIAQQLFSSGTLTTNTYLENGLLEKIEIVAGTGLIPVADHDFEYDILNRLTKASVGSSDVLRKYDSVGRLVSETGIGGSLTEHIYTDFSTAGNIYRKWDDGRQETFQLDRNGFVTSVAWNGTGLGTGSTSLLNVATLNGPDQILTASLQGGSIGISANYDQQKRITNLQYTATPDTETLRYRYDARKIKRVESVKSTAQPGVNRITLHDFDTLSRLVESTSTAATVPITAVSGTQSAQDTQITTVIKPAILAAPHSTFGYSYDLADTRVSYTDPNTYVNSTVSASDDHRLLATTLEDMDYEALGTRSEDGSRTFDVDALGRVVALRDKVNPQVLQIQYDALGRPLTMNDGVNPIRGLQYFGLDTVQEWSGATRMRQYSQHPAIGRFATHVSGQSFQHVNDVQQNCVAVLDTTPALREVHRYDGFGFPTTTTVSASGLEPIYGGMPYIDFKGTPAGPSPFPSSSSGLYQGTFRLYDPTNAVWLSPDSLGYLDGPNMSAYVGQNPINFIDPLGLDKRSKEGEVNNEPKPTGTLDNLEFQLMWNEARRATGLSWPSPVLSAHFDQRTVPEAKRIFVERYAKFREYAPNWGKLAAVAYGEGMLTYNGIPNFNHFLDQDYVPAFLAKEPTVSWERTVAPSHYASFLERLGRNWVGTPGAFPIRSDSELREFGEAAYRVLAPYDLVAGVSAGSAVGLGATAGFDARYFVRGGDAGSGAFYGSAGPTIGYGANAGATIGGDWLLTPDTAGVGSSTYVGPVPSLSISIPLFGIVFGQVDYTPVLRKGAAPMHVLGLRLGVGWSMSFSQRNWPLAPSTTISDTLKRWR